MNKGSTMVSAAASSGWFARLRYHGTISVYKKALPPRSSAAKSRLRMFIRFPFVMSE